MTPLESYLLSFFLSWFARAVQSLTRLLPFYLLIHYLYISARGNVTSSVTLAAPMQEEYSLCQKNPSQVVACKARRFDQAVIKWNKTILILGWWRKGMAQKDSCYWSSFTRTGCVSDPRKKGRQKKPRSRRSTDVLEGQPVARFGFIQKKEIASSQSEK